MRSRVLGFLWELQCIPKEQLLHFPHSLQDLQIRRCARWQHGRCFQPLLNTIELTSKLLYRLHFGEGVSNRYWTNFYIAVVPPCFRWLHDKCGWLTEREQNAGLTWRFLLFGGAKSSNFFPITENKMVFNCHVGKFSLKCFQLINLSKYLLS